MSAKTSSFMAFDTASRNDSFRPRNEVKYLSSAGSDPLPFCVDFEGWMRVVGMTGAALKGEDDEVERRVVKDLAVLVAKLERGNRLAGEGAVVEENAENELLPLKPENPPNLLELSCIDISTRRASHIEGDDLLRELAEELPRQKPVLEDRES